MILVVLAMRACSSPRREKSVCPVVASITVARLAEMAWAFTGRNKTAAKVTAAVLAKIRSIFLTRS